MAEVVNSQRVGTNLSARKVAAPSPTAGSEGRSNPVSIDFSGLGNILKGAVEGISKVQLEEEQKKNEKLFGQFTQARSQLATDFFSGQPTQEIVENVLGFPGKYSKQQAATLKDFQGFISKVDSARTSGKSDLALQLLVAKQQQRFVNAHPELTTEIIALSSNMTGILAPLREAGLSDIKRKRALEQSRIALEDRALASANYEVSSLSDEERSAALSKIRDNANKLTTLTIRAKEISNNLALSKLQKKDKIDTLLGQGGYNTLVTGVLGDVFSVINDDSLSLQEQQVQIVATMSQAKQQVMDATGMSSKDFHQRFGTVWNHIRDVANNNITGSVGLEASTNSLKAIQTLAQLNNPNLVKAIAVIDQLPDVFLKGIAEDRTSLALFTEALGYIKTLIGGEGDDSVVVPPLPKVEDAETDVDGSYSDSAWTSIAGSISNAWNSTTAVEAEGANEKLMHMGAATLAVQFLNDRVGDDGVSGIIKMFPQTARPEFEKALENVDVPAGATRVVGRFIDHLIGSARDVLLEEQGNLKLSLTDDGLLEVSMINPNNNLGAVQRTFKYLNDSIKTLAHLGHSTSYRKQTEDVIRRIQGTLGSE